MAGTCEYSDELLGSTKCGEFLKPAYHSKVWENDWLILIPCSNVSVMHRVGLTKSSGTVHLSANWQIAISDPKAHATRIYSK